MLMALQVTQVAKESPTHRHNIQQKRRDLRPALVPSGTVRELARVFSMVEGEIAAAQTTPSEHSACVQTDAGSS